MEIEYFYTMGKGNISTELGKRIREARTAKGFSQIALADISGINEKYLGRVERGESNITVIKLNKITDAIGVSLSDILKDI